MAVSLRKRRPVFSGFRVYFEPGVVAILFLGFAAGLPLGLTGQTLTAWLTDLDVSRTGIGAFGLVSLAYSLKFLWAPVFDIIHLPVLYGWLGRRRSWLLVCQGGLVAALLAMGAADPRTDLVVVGLLAAGIAFLSASQDVVIDAFRVEALPADRAAPALSGYVLGYRVALVVGVSGSLLLAELLQVQAGAGISGSWQTVYRLMALLMGTGIVVTLMSREPRAPEQDHEPFRVRVRNSVVEPARDLVFRRGFLPVLLFVMLYKATDAFAGAMSYTYMIDGLGYLKSDYAILGKLAGFFATIAGCIAGARIYDPRRPGPALMLAGVLQALSNPVFIWLGLVDRSLFALGTALVIENFCGGIGTVVLLGYLTRLCDGYVNVATRYALLSALAGLGRPLLSPLAGALADLVAWEVFFVVSTLVALPSLVLLFFMMRAGVVLPGGGRVSLWGLSGPTGG